MKPRNLAMISLLSLCTPLAFAQDGGDRSHQRMMDLQQAYYAAEQQKAADKNAAVAGAQDHTDSKKAGAGPTAG